MSEMARAHGLQKFLCVTNRHLAAQAAGIQDADSAAGRAAFLAQIQRVADARPRAVILREKDLGESAYRTLAADVLAICRNAHVPCILHTYVAVAKAFGAEGVHVPLPLLRKLDAKEKSAFPVLGASCHSVADVREAAALGATYVTVGHIYATDCKRGIPPRGLALLRASVKAASIPVYAIGGITRKRLSEVFAAGAAGVCVMSGLMQGDPSTW